MLTIFIDKFSRIESEKKTLLQTGEIETMLPLFYHCKHVENWIQGTTAKVLNN